MDKKLLDALNNLSFALGEIAEALVNGGEAKSATSTSLKSIGLENQIRSISDGVKQLQLDNKKILKNQDTIIGLAKSKTNTQPSALEKTFDTNYKDKIKGGISTILMIASGVLAIGLAFRVIGGVDFASVIALAVSLPLIAMAFEKISNMKDLKGPEMGKVSLIVVGIALAITAVSYILSMVKPVGLLQLMTAILISGMFAAVSFGISRLVTGLSGMSSKDIYLLPILPVVMLSISASIALSSMVLQGVQPVGLFKLTTSILIASMFGVISYGIGRLMNGLGELKNPGKAFAMAATLPIILVAIAGAIALSSLPLSMVKPIGLFQFFTAVMISIVFIPISFSLPLIAKAIDNLNIAKVITMMGILVAMSSVIMISSHILDKTKPIDSGLLFNIVLQSATLSLIAISLGFTMDFLGKKDTKTILMGGLSMILIAGSIMASSTLLSLGNYNNAPSIGWSVSFSLAMLLLTAPVLLLGYASLPVVTMGALGLVVIAAAITAASYILSYMDPKFFYLISDAISYFIKRMSDAVSYGLKVIAPGLKIFLNTVGGSLVKFVSSILPPIVKAVSEFFSDVVKPMMEFLVNSLPKIGQFISSIIDSIIPAMKLVIDGIIQMSKSINETLRIIVDGIKSVGDTVVNIIGSITNGVKIALDGIKSVISSIGGSITSVIDSIKGTINSIGNTVTKVVDSVVGGIERMSKVGYTDLTKSAGNISTFLESITDSISTFSNAKINFANVDKISKLFDGLKQLSSTTTSLSTLPNIFTSIASGVDKLAASISKLNSNLDIEKLNIVKNLAGSVVLLSLMDSDQFSKMMTALEEKAKMFVDIVSDVSGSSQPSSRTSGPVSMTPIRTSKQQTSNVGKTMDDIYGMLATLNTSLMSISGNSGNISKYVDQIKGDSDISLKQN